MPTEKFCGKFASLPLAGDFVSRIARKSGMDDAAVYQIELAVDEAFTNIIEHAYGGEGKGDIEISVTPAREGLRIILRDHGKQFDPDDVPIPDFNIPIEKLQSRGAGLYLIRKIMDEVRFRFDAKKGNELMMLKQW